MEDYSTTIIASSDHLLIIFQLVTILTLSFPKKKKYKKMGTFFGDLSL